jgi:hypothetical protein
VRMLYRVMDFGLVWLIAGAVFAVSLWLWPYLELVAAVGALIVVLIVVNLVDGVRFAIQHRQRLGFRRPVPTARRGQGTSDSAPMLHADTSHKGGTISIGTSTSFRTAVFRNRS